MSFIAGAGLCQCCVSGEGGGGMKVMPVQKSRVNTFITCRGNMNAKLHLLSFSHIYAKSCERCMVHVESLMSGRH